MRHEIERLEALNEDLTDLYNHHMRAMGDRVNKLEAENERLRELLDHAGNIITSLSSGTLTEKGYEEVYDWGRWLLKQIEGGE